VGGESPSENDLLRIGELAREAGVSTQTVQYYCMIGLIEENSRTRGGRRLFNRETIRKIRTIGRLNRSGYPLREIREMFLKRSTRP